MEQESNTVKLRKLEREDVIFLSTLQQEMNTQPHLCQADPRFWVILDYEYREAAGDDDISRICFYEDGCAVEQYYPPAFLAAAYEEACDLCGEDYGAEWLDKYFLERVRGEDGSWSFQDKFGFKNIYQAVLDICKDYAEAHCYTFILETRYCAIARNTMFLTLREAKAHLQANYYHYDSEAHPYAMTAWRSPQVEQLYKILHEVDFSDLVGASCGGVRGNIARNLRLCASDSLWSDSLQKTLARITGAKDTSWRGVMRRIADLIDPATEVGND